MGDKGHNTNLAAEFYVLSILHRLGLNANLTLGNKKSIDLVIVRDVGEAYTIDVKGLAGMTGWPIDNVHTSRAGHYLVFVCFLGKIADPLIVPEVYVVPSGDLKGVTYTAPAGRRLVMLSEMRRHKEKFRDRWDLLT